MDIIELSKKLISYKSVTPDSNGCIEFTKSYLEELGFICDLVTFPHNGDKNDKVNYPVQNLYAKYGSKAPIFAFCGHLDVVPEGSLDAWQSNPYEATIKNIDGRDFLIGRGSEDMKCGVAAFICAIASFIKYNPKFNGSIAILLTMDEEAVSINGIKELLPYIKAKGDNLDACIVAESSCINVLGDYIKVGSRGSLEFDLQVQGLQGHVAYKDKFKNPVTVMANLVATLQKVVLDEGNEYFEASNLEIVSIKTDNTAYNVVPSTIKAMGDIRFNNEQNAEKLKEFLQNFVKAYDGATVSFPNPPSQCFISKADTKIYKILQSVIKDQLDIDVKPKTKGGMSDSRFIASFCDTVEFGLKIGTLHQGNEMVDIEDLKMLQKVYEDFLYRYFKI